MLMALMFGKWAGVSSLRITCHFFQARLGNQRLVEIRTLTEIETQLALKPKNRVGAATPTTHESAVMTKLQSARKLRDSGSMVCNRDVGEPFRWLRDRFLIEAQRRAENDIKAYR